MKAVLKQNGIEDNGKAEPVRDPDGYRSVGHPENLFPTEGFKNRDI